MKDALLIGGLAFIAYQMFKDAMREYTPAVPAATRSGVTPAAGLADGAAYGGGVVGNAFAEGFRDGMPMPREYPGWFGSGWAFEQPGTGGPTYRDQYPRRPGVIDAGGGLDVGLADESGWAD